ncbi:hypothetical protein chiPu_0005783 [Chiloscyllium punctatum]|uniref:Uncharacterized protein n=1 Tax=Chiloscyllium punctatum TaxID=137246 RepID=A0A401SAD0_CHIPU|nr:hypothetical protein [Chiloscyllium punctatum]
MPAWPGIDGDMVEGGARYPRRRNGEGGWKRYSWRRVVRGRGQALKEPEWRGGGARHSWSRNGEGAGPNTPGDGPGEGGA